MTTTTTPGVASTINLVFGGRKKRKGPIGPDGKPTTLEPFAEKKVSIDWVALPDASKEKIIEYGLIQYLGDGAAGAGDQTDFESGIDDKLQKLLSANFTRTTGERASKSLYDSEDKLTKAKIRDMIKAKLKAANLKPDAEKVTAMIEAFYSDTAKSAPFRELARSEIAAQNQLSSGVDATDMLASLGL